MARYGAPHCADDGPRFIKRAQTLLAPATQLSVMQDGDCIWGSEFGDAGVATRDPTRDVGSCAVVNVKGARERAFPTPGNGEPVSFARQCLGGTDGTPNFIRELCRNFGHIVIFASVLDALLQNVLLSFASGHKVAIHTHVSTADSSDANIKRQVTNSGDLALDFS